MNFRLTFRALSGIFFSLIEYARDEGEEYPPRGRERTGDGGSPERPSER